MTWDYQTLNLSADCQNALSDSRLADKVRYIPGKLLKLHLQLQKPLAFEYYMELIESLEIKFDVNVALQITTEQTIISNQEFKRYVDFFLADNNHIQHKIVYDDLGETITIKTSNDDIYEQLIKLKNHLDGFLMQSGICQPYSISLIERKEVTPPQVVKIPRTRSDRKTYQLTGIDQLTSGDNRFAVIGRVVDEKIITTKNGSKIHSCFLIDKQSSIMCKRFQGRQFTKDDMVEFGNNALVKLYGTVRFDDKFANENVLTIDDFELIEEEPIKSDVMGEQRIEFHAHTNMSEMDGISEADHMIDVAHKMGMKGIAITDHQVVQSFPAAYNKLRQMQKQHPDLDFKVIFGIEMNMVDDQLTIVTRPTNDKLDDLTYVILDLETTGLSCRYDEIIEFGAIKVKNDEIVDKLQMFIKPTISIPIFIQNKTNITNEMVNDAMSIQNALPKIREFIGDCCIVAHNASFDLGFLDSHLLGNGYPTLSNPVIDTLSMGKEFIPDLKFFALGKIARSMNIRYDDTIAHRADYDCEILKEVFKRLLTEALNNGRDNLISLQNNQSSDNFKRAFKSHVNLLVKEQKGMKDLFKLVTLSHTDYLAYSGKTSSKNNGEEVAAEPRIPRGIINQYREHILVGSSCFNNEIFELANTRSQAELEAAMNFYDYIEIQPPGHYEPLLRKHSVPSLERLYQVLTNIVHTAKRLGKLVIVTNDAHYALPSEKQFRDIYIVAQGIGGVRHPLYFYDAKQRIGFETPAQHLQLSQDLLKQFDFLDDPQMVKTMVIDNTLQLADMIDQVTPLKDKLYTPSLPNDKEILVDVCHTNAKQQYGDPLPAIVSERLERELNSITTHGYSVIYYIAHLLVKRSLEDGYLVGSRGSVGSSFAATMARITEVNPLPPHYFCPNCQFSEFFTDGSVKNGYDLPAKVCPKCQTPLNGDGQDIPFETFLGFSGDKVPDIDLNFSSDYQEKAHAYTKTIFGEDKVFRAGTIGSVAQTTAFGYVSGYYEEMNIYQPPNQGIRSFLANGATGVKRTTGQHPGGIIVIPQSMDVHDFTPVQFPANNPNSAWKTTHFAFGDIHDNVLKLDILGHVDPAAMHMLKRISGIDPRNINLNDAKVLSLFSSIDAMGISDPKYKETNGALGLPEFGTDFVKGILDATKPTSFEELVIISGLSHGTDVWLNNANELINNKTCSLKNVIGCRDDIMVYLTYQGLPSKTAFDIMESVRKGKGLKPDWEVIMRKHNVPEWYIESCKKIKYMFPKAHAVAYVMMCLRVAWFKVYYPHYYYATYFSKRCDAFDIETMCRGERDIRYKLNDIISRKNDYELSKKLTNKERQLINTLEVALEMTLRGYRFKKVDLYQSQANEFMVDPQNDHLIIPPFTSIDSLGENVAERIVNARDERKFISREDLMKRTGLNKTLMEKLAAMGCLSELQEENQLSLF